MRKEREMKVKVTASSVRFYGNNEDFPSYIEKIKELGYDVEEKEGDYFDEYGKFYMDVEISDLIKIASALDQEEIIVCVKDWQEDIPLIEIYDTYRE